jgi:hypothetical protein
MRVRRGRGRTVPSEFSSTIAKTAFCIEMLAGSWFSASATNSGKESTPFWLTSHVAKVYRSRSSRSMGS